MIAVIADYESTLMTGNNTRDLSFVVFLLWKFYPFQLIWYQTVVFYFPSDTTPYFLYKLKLSCYYQTVLNALNIYWLQNCKYLYIQKKSVVRRAGSHMSTSLWGRACNGLGFNYLGFLRLHSSSAQWIWDTDCIIREKNSTCFNNCKLSLEVNFSRSSVYIWLFI